MWFREGIHPRVPEGSSWEEVEVPKEVAQLSCGPGDLLWALLWDGNLLVRTGLSLDSPTGQQPLQFTFEHNAITFNNDSFLIFGLVFCSCCVSKHLVFSIRHIMGRGGITRERG